jgi:carboxypeptidase C (cathepsin A)
MTDRDANEKADVTESPAVEPRPSAVSTSHTVTINGTAYAYTATVGTLILRDEDDDKPKASMFYVAYTLDDVADASKRPLTFSFNGGPGSSSVWLHLGLLGPRRVLMDEEGNPPPPPYRLVDNAHSLLDRTDLVFIDPVSTGFSRAVPGEEPDQFHNYDKDIESVGDFIRLYTSRNRRWTSPKFLIGESYGTTRAAGLSEHLQTRHGMYLNGVMLISSILNFQTARFTPGNDLPYILFLPTYAATAWYHGRLDPEWQADLHKTLAAVEQFALTDYTLALMQGAALPPEEHDRIARQLAAVTGLSESYIANTHLRIRIDRFVKELLRQEGRTVGRLDSRFRGIDRDAAGEGMEFDPSYANIHGPYAATLNQYVREELGFESDLPYEILTSKVHPWKFEKQQNEFLNVGEALRKAMSAHPHLRVFVGNGYFDLATPYFATEYTFNHLALDPELHRNVSMGFYEAGHMMYIHMPSLAELKSDLSAFINAATGG